MPRPAVPPDPVLLGAYDAKRCARRIHNEWDPSIEKAAWEVPAELQLRFDAGAEFEERVFAELRGCLAAHEYADLTSVRGKVEAVTATADAMAGDVPLIIGGWLPDDDVGGRKGRPDLLLRVAPGRYVPGDAKGHKIVVARKKGTLTWSLPGSPATRQHAPGLTAKADRIDDFLQLAHYWRMLETIGRAPTGPATGFIVGTDRHDELNPDGHVLTWLDLDTELFETYSRSRGTVRRTALERYDHEHAFRLKVATAAAHAEPPLVQPIFVNECESCPWLDHCLDVAGPDTASAQITSGRLSVREWAALADAGVVTLDDLASLDVTPAFAADYLPEVSHVRDPLDRLATAVRRARMIRDGRTLERETTGPIAVPRADIEIDFDIEWDTDDHVYLWGALVSRDGAEPAYHAVVNWEALDGAGAVALAEEFADWLRAQITGEAGRTVRVYHYGPPEPTHLKRILGGDAVADLLVHFVDLLPIVREHFFGVDGHGIKKVAPAFGFEWRDDDPGGLQSQVWLINARAGDTESRERILAYNEDDVRATAAVRRGCDALSPGSRSFEFCLPAR